MDYPKEFVQYLVEFHGSRDYFECHEILEEYWKTQLPLKRESVWVGFIQLAVGFYHYRRTNYSGAIRTLQKSKQILQQHTDELDQLGMEPQGLINLVTESIHKCHNREPYTSPSLPINCPDLLIACQSMCLDKNYSWNCKSNLEDSLLINRHSTRDRTDIIQERINQLNKKKQKEIEKPD